MLGRLIDVVVATGCTKNEVGPATEILEYELGFSTPEVLEPSMRIGRVTVHPTKRKITAFNLVKVGILGPIWRGVGCIRLNPYNPLSRP